jgi:TLC domain
MKPSAQSSSASKEQKKGVNDPAYLHDVFNLYILPIVNATNVGYFLYDSEVTFILLFYAFLFYMVIDTVWVLVQPKSVGSPVTIVVHHVVCLLGWLLPYFYARKLFRWTSAGLLVELNTFLLIARRVWGRPLFMEVLFYTSWVGFRIIMYPYVLYLFVFEYLEFTAKEATGNYINTALLILVIIILLNMLNFKWSYDLFKRSLSLAKAHQKTEDDKDHHRL